MCASAASVTVGSHADGMNEIVASAGLLALSSPHVARRYASDTCAGNAAGTCMSSGSNVLAVIYQEDLQK